MEAKRAQPPELSTSESFPRLLAVYFTAADVLRFCSTCAHCASALSECVRMVLQASHNLTGDSVAELTDAEACPTSFYEDFTRPGTRKVVQGAAFDNIDVGSFSHLVTQAQYPPAQGDAWSMELPLRRGAYRMVLFGFENPYHGTLNLYLDDQLATRTGINWRGRRTKEKCFSLRVTVDRTGWHLLFAKTTGGSDRYCWMCLTDISLERI